eukprot:comp23889_c0_seq1/m.41956 comp23889_c0_seq1/g.41956  ORF comp23889_c0_seq1/g.41956 comp23889_c0_seq1/m.41956 type:complete len:395 (-) comp23889_c0_seq1:137-1321(-)
MAATRVPLISAPVRTAVHQFRYMPVRLFSTAATPSGLLTTASPYEHSGADVGKWYVFGEGTKSQGPMWGTVIQSQQALLREQSLLVRKPATDILGVLRRQHKEKASFMPTIVINGSDGSGKTSTLSHVVRGCHTGGWLVMHVPNVLDLFENYDYVDKSTFKEGRLDLPFEASALLAYFKKLNGKALAQIKLQHSYDLRGMKFGPDNTLLDLASFGAGPWDLKKLDRVPPAADALGAVCKELRHVTSVPVLVALDGFNGLFDVTTVKDHQANPVHASRLSITRHFVKFLEPEHNLKHGAMVVALSKRGVRTQHKYTKPITQLLDACTPLKDPFQPLAPLLRVRTSNYTDSELTSYLGYLRSRSAFAKDISDPVVMEAKFLTDSNPKEVANLALFV